MNCYIAGYTRDTNMTNYCEHNGCEYCQQMPVSDYYGTKLCDECIKMEETTDWDKFEADKRARIAENNEY